MSGARPFLLRLVLVVAAGLALQSPSLRTGFYVDDYVHQLALDGELALAPWALYDFGSAAEWTALETAGGGLPWWTFPDWRIRFFRPLASIFLWAQHGVFGGRATGYHLTSIALYALLLGLVFGLARALGLARGTATGAVALLAASGATLVPVGWIANQNALLEVLFSTAAVLVAWRGRGSGSVIAALGLALGAALSKESGVVALVLVAGAWWARRERSGRLVACVAVGLACAYAAFLVTAGYGTRSAFYATPWGGPEDLVRYLTRVAILASAGGLALVTPFPLDVVGWNPGLALPVGSIGLALVAPLAIWTARRVRGHPASVPLAVGLVATLAVQGAAPVSDRLLLAPAIASSCLLAIAVARARTEEAGRSRAVAGLVVASAGIASALGVLAQGIAVAGLAGETRSTVLAADVGPPELGPRHALVMQAPSGLVAFAAAATWAAESRDRDVRFAIFQAGRRGFEWTREDARTVVVRSLDEPFLTGVFEIVYLAGGAPPSVGARWSHPLFEAEALEVEGYGLRAVRLRFARPLDERLRLLVWDGGRLVAASPPAPGRSASFPTVAVPGFAPP